LDEIRGIAFCAVMGTITISPEDPITFIDVNIIAGGVPTRNIGGRVLNFMGSDHVWLQYSVLESSELKGGNLQVEFYGRRSDSVLFKSCGVHLIHKHEELHEDVIDGHLDIPDEEIENSVDFREGVQVCKRRHDDEDHNLESNGYPPQKRHSSTCSCHTTCL
jgi:hypothetical protein